MSYKIKRIVNRNLDTRYNHYQSLKRVTRKKSKAEKVVLLVCMIYCAYFPAFSILSQSHTITVSAPIESAQASEYSTLCGLDVVECDNEPKKELQTFRKVKGTTYNAEVGQTDSSPFIMANGKRVNESAVASNCYPLGTKINAKGLGVYTVEDRMNRRYTADCGTDSERIDFFKFSRRDNFAKVVEISLIK